MKDHRNQESGQGLCEWALILMLAIAVICLLLIIAGPYIASIIPVAATPSVEQTGDNIAAGVKVLQAILGK